MFRYIRRPHIPVTHVRVDTTAYERFHGVPPGGVTLWVFRIGAATSSWFAPYAEAEARAVARAARCGIAEVVVCA